MNNKLSIFWRQIGVLTSRYFHICINNKQSLVLNFTIPILTALIVCSVACGNMFSAKPTTDHSINKGYPVLSWQNVDQEKDGELILHKSGVGKIDDEQVIYFIFSEKNNYSLNDYTITVKSKTGESIKTFTIDDIKTVSSKDKKGIYSLYAYTNDVLESGRTYSVTLNCKGQESTENKISLDVPHIETDVKNLVTKASYGYKPAEKLDSDFDIYEYVNNPANQNKIASIPNAVVKVNGQEYILIKDAETFAYIFSDYRDENISWDKKNYFLIDDIDLNGYDDLKPLGYDNKYTGIFDGNGKVVYNFTSKYGGLFKSLQGTVKNIGIEKSKSTTDEYNAGIIAGTVEPNGIIANSYVKKCTVKTTGADCSAGGVAGKISSNSKSAEIYGCYVIDTKIKGDKFTGGLVGSCQDGKIKSCYGVCTLKSKKNAGEFAGYLGSNSTVDNCYCLNNKDFKPVGDNQNTKEGVYSVSKDELKNASEIISYSAETLDDDQYYFKSDGQLSEFSDTQVGLFMLVCVAIFVGICNSIQEVCKERNILKREYMTNLNLGSYVSSKIIVQALLCAIQMIMVLVIFSIFVSSKQLPNTGVIFHSLWIEYFVTMFLLCFASDTLSLMISSVVKTSSTANIFIPIILIVQIVFSGVLFDLGETVNKFAYLMFSKWGIAGLAISSRLNNGRVRFLLDHSDYELHLGPSMSKVESMFTSQAGQLLLVWLILILFTVVFSLASVVLLTRIKKDKR